MHLPFSLKGAEELLNISHTEQYEGETEGEEECFLNSFCNSTIVHMLKNKVGATLAALWHSLDSLSHMDD